MVLCKISVIFLVGKISQIVDVCCCLRFAGDLEHVKLGYEKRRASEFGKLLL